MGHHVMNLSAWLAAVLAVPTFRPLRWGNTFWNHAAAAAGRTSYSTFRPLSWGNTSGNAARFCRDDISYRLSALSVGATPLETLVACTGSGGNPLVKPSLFGRTPLENI